MPPTLKEIATEGSEANADLKKNGKISKARRRLLQRHGGTNVAALVIGGIILLIGIYLLARPFVARKVPPAAPVVESISPDEAQFFIAWREAAEKVALGKNHFILGKKILDTSGPGLAVLINGDSAVESNRYNRAAESFARAIEHFDLAEEIVKNAKGTDLTQELKQCREKFEKTAKKYREAAKILNEFAKGYYLQDADKIEDNARSDAKAKFEIADTTMSEILLEGCRGKFFKYIQARDAFDKKLTLNVYKDFYRHQYPTHQGTIELVLDYKDTTVSPTAAAGEVLPVAVPVPQGTSPTPLPAP